MHQKPLLFLLGLLLLAAALPAAAQGEAGDLLARINQLRASVGRGPYSLNGALSAAAQDQANWIAATGSVSHTRPDGSGPRTRALNAGYPSTQVSENIYGGTNANVGSAWSFWVNSGVHYAGLVHPSYNDIGIGIARSEWGAAYVLVFGNSGGPPPPPPSSGGGGAAGSGAPAGGGGGGAARSQPSFVVGQDPFGNIMHQVQPGDTLGDIALIYGYSWDDIPAMMALNNIEDVRDLEVGSIFLVPRRDGTFTPTPGGPTNTPRPTATPIPPSITPFVALIPVESGQVTIAVTPLEALTHAAMMTQGLPTPTPDLTQQAAATAVQAAGTVVAMVMEPGDDPPQRIAAPAEGPQAENPPAPADRTNRQLVIVIAVAVQVIVLVFAAMEYFRRQRAKEPRKWH